MNILRLTIISVFMAVFSLSAYAIKAPILLKPDRTASLYPLISWTPVKGAKGYSLKLKEYQQDDTYRVIERATIKKTTTYRITTKLTDGNLYKLSLFTKGRNKTKSNTITYYFTATKKMIVLSHTDLDSAEEDDGTGENFQRTYKDFKDQGKIKFYGFTKAINDTWYAVDGFCLPEGAIITEVCVYYYDRTKETSIFTIYKSSFSEYLPTAILEPYLTMESTDSPVDGTSANCISYSNISDPNAPVIENGGNQYHLAVELRKGHRFHRATIEYAD